MENNNHAFHTQKLGTFANRGLQAWVALVLICCAFSSVDLARAEEAARVLEVLRDYESVQPGPSRPIRHHSWPDELQHRAHEFSSVTVETNDSAAGRCCRIAIKQTFPWRGRDYYTATVIGPDYLPPEADAVRMRIKVIRGTVRLSVGSPTVYFGHSDVRSRTEVLRAGDAPRWETVEFSLHHHLSRNFRRARFGRSSPVIHYTRWIQEPLYLYLNRLSDGEFLLDQVELITRGEGRPFPKFPPDQIRHIATAADFEAEELSKAFTFFQEPIDLTQSPYLVRPNWQPPTLSRVDTRPQGGKSLRIEQRGTEEVCFTGIMLPAARAANALALDLKSDHKTARDELMLDFIVYVGSRAEKFPWEQFAPPESWQARPEIAFTYYLSQSRTQGADYAFYHVRRTVPNGEWTRLVLPFADFVCAYGQGDCEEFFRHQTPLPAAQTIALAVLPPYGLRRAATRITIDEVALVHVPGTPVELRSFPQPPVKP